MLAITSKSTIVNELLTYTYIGKINELKNLLEEKNDEIFEMKEFTENYEKRVCNNGMPKGVGLVGDEMIEEEVEPFLSCQVGQKPHKQVVLEMSKKGIGNKSKQTVPKN